MEIRPDSSNWGEKPEEAKTKVRCNRLTTSLELILELANESLRKYSGLTTIT